MKLHELKPAEGSRKVRNRVGRGIGYGNGKTAGKGHKGQNARSAVFVLASKVVKLHYSVVYQNASQTLTVKSLLL